MLSHSSLILAPLLHVILNLYIYLYEWLLRFKMWFYWMMKIWNLRKKWTVRCLIDCKLLSSVVFIMYTLSLPFSLCFNSTNCVFRNEPEIYYPSRWILRIFLRRSWIHGQCSFYLSMTLLCEFNRDDREAVRITRCDIKCLDPQVFLSSHVINFYIK